jgi:hypothetical protein
MISEIVRSFCRWPSHPGPLLQVGEGENRCALRQGYCKTLYRRQFAARLRFNLKTALGTTAKNAKSAEKTEWAMNQATHGFTCWEKKNRRPVQSDALRFALSAFFRGKMNCGI